jgi:hypothetical protein
MTSEDTNARSLARFEKYVNGVRSGIKRQYDRGVNRDLSQQKSQDLFKRNVTAVLKQTYEGALTELAQLSLDGGGMEGGQEHADLTVRVLEPFDGLVEELIQYALQKHRTSCALSNFPDEHKPSQGYIAEVIRETSGDWQSFVLRVSTVVSR